MTIRRSLVAVLDARLDLERPVPGHLAVRADVLERLATRARKLAAKGPFTTNGELRRVTGLRDEELAALLPELGYRLDRATTVPTFLPRGPAGSVRHGRRRAKAHKTAKARPDSPFAKLGDLEVAK